jgi:hypothetical protein
MSCKRIEGWDCRCEVCGHVWTARGSKPPRRCSKKPCQTVFWNHEKIEVPQELRPLAGLLAYRIVSKVRIDGECWIWTGGKNSWKYGKTTINGRSVAVHVLIYTLLVGKVPHGKELDHTCRRSACCNPKHLEPVTHAENVRRVVKYGRNIREDDLSWLDRIVD